METLTYDDILFGYDLIFEDLQLYRRGRWQGLPMFQNPGDLLAISDLLWRIQPELLVEIGSGYGGSTIFYKGLMRDYNEQAVLVSIDDNPPYQTMLDHPLGKSPMLQLLHGQSRDERVLSAVRLAARSAERIVVMHDGSHSFEQVYADLLVYSELVTLGSFLIVQDTKLDRIERKPGPLAAVRQFLNGPGKGRFVIDRGWEYFLYSQHHKGFLRRVAP